MNGKLKVKVCDSIMGSGKTQAAIRLMNEDVAHNYIFVTPYLEETERIVGSCPGRKFQSPRNTGDGKLDNLHRLLHDGYNVCTTHALFKTCTTYTMELIKSGKYKLILDEVVDAIDTVEMSQSDLQILLDSSQIIISEQGTVEWIDKEYTGKFADIRLLAESGNLICHNKNFLYWVMSIGIFRSFEEVIFLTYLFDSQVQKYYCDIHQIEYSYIYPKKCEDGSYKFTDKKPISKDTPLLAQRINVVDDMKLNLIGETKTALSSSWFAREKTRKNKPSLRILKNNIYNIFNNKYDAVADNRMWTTFKDCKSVLSGKGYIKSFVSCNSRSTNKYRHKTHLAYCINVYLVPHLKNYFLANGVDVKEDMYALSEMIQWIWRSAIRDGNEIWVYVPSKRMRALLINWINSL